MRFALLTAFLGLAVAAPIFDSATLNSVSQSNAGIIDYIKCKGFDPFDRKIFQAVFKGACDKLDGGSSSGGGKKKGRKGGN